MKHKSLVVVLCWLFMAVTPLAAQHHQSSSSLAIDEIRLTSGFRYDEQFLGQSSRGHYWAERFGLTIEAGHKTIGSLLLKSNDYGAVDVSGLSLNAREVYLGFSIPATSVFTIRTVYNNWLEYGTSEAVDAGGIYLDYRPDGNTRLEYGTEMFLDQAPELYFITGVFSAPTWLPSAKNVIIGLSSRYVQQEGEDHHFEDRLAGGVILSMGRLQFGAGASGRINQPSWSHDERAWTVGAALPARISDVDTWQPAYYAVYRSKPGSRFLMVIGAHGSYALNGHTVAALFQSSFRSLNVPTRVVNNQNFDIKVLNVYNQELGRLSYSLVMFEFDVTEAVSGQSTEASVFYTHTPMRRGWCTLPFVGYTYVYEDVISYNMIAYCLESLGHTRHELECGARCRLWDKADKTAGGILRLSLATFVGPQGIEGGSLTATMWF